MRLGLYFSAVSAPDQVPLFPRCSMVHGWMYTPRMYLVNAREYDYGPGIDFGTRLRSIFSSPEREEEGRHAARAVWDRYTALFYALRYPFVSRLFVVVIQKGFSFGKKGCLDPWISSRCVVNVVAMSAPLFCIFYSLKTHPRGPFKSERVVPLLAREMKCNRGSQETIGG